MRYGVICSPATDIACAVLQRRGALRRQFVAWVCGPLILSRLQRLFKRGQTEKVRDPLFSGPGRAE